MNPGSSWALALNHQGTLIADTNITDIVRDTVNMCFDNHAVQVIFLSYVAKCEHSLTRRKKTFLIYVQRLLKGLL